LVERDEGHVGLLGWNISHHKDTEGTKKKNKETPQGAM
jgi:hypothetical protein